MACGKVQCFLSSYHLYCNCDNLNHYASVAASLTSSSYLRFRKIAMTTFLVLNKCMRFLLF